MRGEPDTACARGGAGLAGMSARALASLLAVAAGAHGQCEPFDRVRLLGRELEEAPAAREAILFQLLSLEQDLAQLGRGGDPVEACAALALGRSKELRALWTADLDADGRIGLLREAYDHAAVSGSVETLARSGVVLGNELLAAGRPLDAHELLARCRDATRASVGTKPYLLYALAESARVLDRYDEALEMLADAEGALDEGAAAESLRGRILGSRGQVLLSLGLTELAAGAIEAEATIADREGASAKDRSASHAHRMNLALAQGRYEHAVRLADGFLTDVELYRRVERMQGALLLARGEALVALEWIDPAREREAARALGRALELELTEVHRVRAERLLGEAALDGGEPAGAAECLRRARERLERSRVDDPEALLLDTLAARIARATGASGEELRRALERLRASFERRLESWHLVPPRPGGLGFLHHPARRAALVELLRLCSLVGEPDGGSVLEGYLRADSAGTLVPRLGGGACTREDVLGQLLEAEHGILVLLPAPRGSLAIAIDRAGVEALELSSDAALQVLRRDWNAALLERLAAGRSEAADDTVAAAERRERAAAARLASELFPAPVRRRIAGWRRITFAGLELLGSTRVELLPVGGAEHLGLEREVDHLGSLALGAVLARRRAARPAAADERDSTLLVTRPSPAEAILRRFPRMADLPPRLAGLAGTLDGNVIVLERGEATVAGLRRSGAAGMWLFLCHGSARRAARASGGAGPFSRSGRLRWALDLRSRRAARRAAHGRPGIVLERRRPDAARRRGVGPSRRRVPGRRCGRRRAVRP